MLRVTDLDGQPVMSVTEGTDYLVPCVFGIPVICPSHVDQGTDGPTSRHWHTDDRFDGSSQDYKWWAKQTRKRFAMLPSDSVRTDIVADEGQPVVMERKTAVKNSLRPSGAVWTSVAWLLEQLGDKPAVDGHCVHHHTALVDTGDCLTCPAHGLKYRKDGQPLYTPPFFVKLRYIDWEFNIHHVREPLKTGEEIKFCVHGNYDPFPRVYLEDANGTKIMAMDADTKVRQAQPGGTSTLDITIGAWPSDGYCPRLVKDDPR